MKYALVFATLSVLAVSAPPALASAPGDTAATAPVAAPAAAPGEPAQAGEAARAVAPAGEAAQAGEAAPAASADANAATAGAAAPAAAAQTVQFDPNQRICQTQSLTGSRTSQVRICHTRAEWRRMTNAGREVLQGENEYRNRMDMSRAANPNPSP